MSVCSGDVFSASLDLPVGEYLYKYIVDEQWVINKNQVRDFGFYILYVSHKSSVGCFFFYRVSDDLFLI